MSHHGDVSLFSAHIPFFKPQRYCYTLFREAQFERSVDVYTDQNLTSSPQILTNTITLVFASLNNH